LAPPTPPWTLRGPPLDTSVAPLAFLLHFGSQRGPHPTRKSSLATASRRWHRHTVCPTGCNRINAITHTQTTEPKQKHKISYFGCQLRDVYLYLSWHIVLGPWLWALKGPWSPIWTLATANRQGHEAGHPPDRVQGSWFVQFVHFCLLYVCVLLRTTCLEGRYPTRLLETSRVSLGQPVAKWCHLLSFWVTLSHTFEAIHGIALRKMAVDLSSTLVRRPLPKN